MYPALVDEGASVGMRAFLDREEAEESHRAGCVRLFLLEHYDHVDFVRRKLPVGPASRLHAASLSLEDRLGEALIQCAAEGALGKMPRSGAAFARSSLVAKERLFESAQLLCSGLEQAVESYHRVSEWMEAHLSLIHI